MRQGHWQGGQVQARGRMQEAGPRTWYHVCLLAHKYSPQTLHADHEDCAEIALQTAYGCMSAQVTFYLLRYATRRDGVTCCCGEHRAGSERDALPLIEEASRDQLGAHEPEEPYMAREPDGYNLKGHCTSANGDQLWLRQRKSAVVQCFQKWIIGGRMWLWGVDRVEAEGRGPVPEGSALWLALSN
ncbi:hypothetical protein EYF80_009633 [Liparis tanakae]|uniref:Uncharacterized protein n=1 Tax=Liparis tanakae TaxID=230148 RepID=A0A4Z2IS60_9TELE|nr:hypothetical protein EYF80_009633 [Liparis tanakae]